MKKVHHSLYYVMHHIFKRYRNVFLTCELSEPSVLSTFIGMRMILDVH